MDFGLVSKPVVTQLLGVCIVPEYIYDCRIIACIRACIPSGEFRPKTNEFSYNTLNVFLEKLMKRLL